METTLETYLKDPAAIEEKSFKMIRQATDLSGFSDLEQQVVMRLVHTCGNPDIARQVRFSANAVEAGIAALVSSCNILCDVEMVRHGLTKRFLESEPLCFLNSSDVAKKAAEKNESRSMTALDHWTPHLEGSIAIIRLVVGVRAALEQQLHELNGALVDRKHQRRPAMFFFCVDLCFLLEQQLHGRNVAPVGGNNQRR